MIVNTEKLLEDLKNNDINILEKNLNTIIEIILPTKRHLISKKRFFEGLNKVDIILSRDEDELFFELIKNNTFMSKDELVEQATRHIELSSDNEYDKTIFVDTFKFLLDKENLAAFSDVIEDVSAQDAIILTNSPEDDLPVVSTNSIAVEDIVEGDQGNSIYSKVDIPVLNISFTQHPKYALGVKCTKEQVKELNFD